ncbi:MAG: hypothetical protein COA69_06100 [Robiginitomaculum sp.]|nr:MAG: hypothetical protein COA69_06100 [Robiginitomaculum sp.]
MFISAINGLSSSVIALNLLKSSPVNAQQSQGSTDPLLAINKNDQIQDADDSFSVDLTQSLADKQIEVYLTINALASDVSAAKDRGAYLEAAFLGLAKMEYSKVARVLSDKIESRNEKTAALAVERLDVASLENVKDIITGATGAEDVDADIEAENGGQALDKKATEAQEAAEALKDLTA